jgi:thiol-disulfide isomerase/thioredoxin
MSLTYTPQGELGSDCPDFNLKSVDGQTFTLKNFSESEALVVMFICNHCPYVKAIEDRLLKLVSEFKKKNVSFVGICANDPTEYPEDAPSVLLARWTEKNYGFPYLLDETQAIAKKFGAVCTPDIYLYDKAKKLRYRGRLDDSWRNPDLVKREELKDAIAALVSGKNVAENQHPSMGCSIKWKSE